MLATSTRRGGFTLVELFVVLGIILVLVGISVLVANSGLVGNIRATGGTDRISGWLTQARARAMRDGAPRGVRFGAPDANGFIREAVLVEMPEPYVAPGTVQLMIGQWPPTGGGAPQKHIYLVDVSGNAATRTASYNDIQAGVAVGDTLSIPNLGTIHQVSALTMTTVNFAGSPTQALEVLVTNSNLIPDIGAAASTTTPTAAPWPVTYSATTFGVHRQARPVFGEPALPVPEGIAIDSANSLIPTDAAGNREILFSPNGEVMNAGGFGRAVLWVRNPEAMATDPRQPTGMLPPNPAFQDLRTTYEQAGEMTLIAVYTKTGAVAIHPVTLPDDETPATPHDPYAYTKDGRASGL